MHHFKGRVTAVHHGRGCWEVIVRGESPGTFLINDRCIWPIVETEGADWVGREVEYVDGKMRFLDTPSAEAVQQPTVIPCCHPLG